MGADAANISEEMENGALVIGINIAQGTEQAYIPLLTSLRRRRVNRWSPLSSDHCIYKVPKKFFVGNEAIYTPEIISIGPIHHGREGLEDVEEYKERFLKDFLRRTQVELEDLVKFVKEREAQLRNCYADRISLHSDELLEVIIVDAAFTIELLLKYPNERADTCRILKRPSMVGNIRREMLLLENQLPLFLLEDVFKFPMINHPEGSGEEDALIKLVCDFIGGFEKSGVKGYDLEQVQSSKPLHFLDCLRNCYLSCAKSPSMRRLVEDLSIPSITKLHQAGVRFSKSSSTHLFDVEFRDGVLLIPHIHINRTKEKIFKNLLVFKQCHHRGNSQFTDYFILMNQLIKTPQDVELLINGGIITNRLGDISKLANFFSSIQLGLATAEETYFADIYEQLTAYYRAPQNRWKATLKQNYFNSPWAGISAVAASLLLVLTFIQTVFSIIRS